jgi:hypothetical protein
VVGRGQGCREQWAEYKRQVKIKDRVDIPSVEGLRKKEKMRSHEV